MHSCFTDMCSPGNTLRDTTIDKLSTQPNQIPPNHLNTKPKREGVPNATTGSPVAQPKPIFLYQIPTIRCLCDVWLAAQAGDPGIAGARNN